MEISEFTHRFVGRKLHPYQKTMLKFLDETPEPELTYHELEIIEVYGRENVSFMSTPHGTVCIIKSRLLGGKS